MTPILITNIYIRTPLIDFVFMSNTKTECYRSRATALSFSPLVEKFNVQTPKLKILEKKQRGYRVLESHTYTDGFKPNSPVATLIPSRFRSRLIISSRCRLKNLLIRNCIDITSRCYFLYPLQLQDQQYDIQCSHFSNI